ncbi:MAG: response regulator [Methylococcaceae bacterium]|nr:response regulator [Methylococcaceae bacterium]
MQSSTILIVDDNAANLRVICTPFENEGLRVLIARAGEEALERARLAHPDLILMDVMMPGIDGFETCRRLKQDPELEDIPVIFMSALAGADDKVKGFAAGGLDYITKPFQLSEVKARVLSHLELYALRRRLTRQNEELSRIRDELETFTYTVSHDLKAPLRWIDGYCALIEKRLADSEDTEIQAVTTKVRRATRQMNHLIDDLLTYSKVERRQIERKPVDLAELAAAVAAEFDKEVEERGVELSLRVPPLHWPIDNEGLTLTLRNLIGNALKFTRNHRAPAVEIGAEQQPGRLRLWVRDNGIGFAMEYSERIFEIFQRLEHADAYPGTGVGLAIVRRAVQRMGGRVWAESEPGAGANFYLELPEAASDLWP